jgi:hypothetical protein
MSNEVKELEEKFLADKINRRAALLSIIAGNPLKASWPGIVVGCLFLVIGLSALGETYSYFMLLCGILEIVGVYVCIINRRIDALVDLLEQDGMLQGAPCLSEDRVDKQKQS